MRLSGVIFEHTMCMYSYMYMCSCGGKIRYFSVVERGDYQRSKLDCLLPNLAAYYREVASEVSL